MNGEAIAALDRAAACHHWSRDYAQSVALEYQRFIELAQDCDGLSLVPARDVDLLWHEHLADATYADVVHSLAPKHDTHTSHDHAARYEATLGRYRKRFGDPGTIWSTAAECQVDAPPPPD